MVSMIPDERPDPARAQSVGYIIFLGREHQAATELQEVPVVVLAHLAWLLVMV